MEVVLSARNVEPNCIRLAIDLPKLERPGRVGKESRVLGVWKYEILWLLGAGFWLLGAWYWIIETCYWLQIAGYGLRVMCAGMGPCSRTKDE